MGLRATARIAAITVWVLALAGWGAPCQAVCEWTRQYGMACSGCHTAYPRLNSTGLAFRQNGYRFVRGEAANLNLKTLANYVGPTWSPTLTTGGGRGSIVAPTDFKIHIGGAVGKWGAFLVQPTPGGSHDFNMAQILLTGGSAKNAVRFVGGRVYAWANGGGNGASDRFSTATLPWMLSAQQGVNPGGLGSGARLEYTRNGLNTLALFASDMSATDTRAPVLGVSFSRRMDRRSASFVELFAAQGVVPLSGKPDAQATRCGLFVNRSLLNAKGEERVNLLAGLGAGQANRAVSASLPRNFLSGFVEADWQARPGLLLLARQDWQNGATFHGATTGLTLGTAFNLTRNLRLDNDLVLPHPGQNAAKLLTRLRVVY